MASVPQGTAVSCVCDPVPHLLLGSGPQHCCPAALSACQGCFLTCTDAQSVSHAPSPGTFLAWPHLQCCALSTLVPPRLPQHKTQWAVARVHASWLQPLQGTCPPPASPPAPQLLPLQVSCPCQLCLSCVARYQTKVEVYTEPTGEGSADCTSHLPVLPWSAGPVAAAAAAACPPACSGPSCLGPGGPASTSAAAAAPRQAPGPPLALPPQPHRRRPESWQAAHAPCGAESGLSAVPLPHAAARPPSRSCGHRPCSRGALLCEAGPLLAHCLPSGGLSCIKSSDWQHAWHLQRCYPGAVTTVLSGMCSKTRWQQWQRQHCAAAQQLMRRGTVQDRLCHLCCCRAASRRCRCCPCITQGLQHRRSPHTTCWRPSWSSFRRELPWSKRLAPGAAFSIARMYSHHQSAYRGTLQQSHNPGAAGAAQCSNDSNSDSATCIILSRCAMHEEGRS